jgi:hypothetical protein
MGRILKESRGVFMYKEKTILDSEQQGPRSNPTVAEPEVHSAVVVDLKLESELAAGETAVTVEADEHVVYAISVSEHRKYGCTKCGCKNGSGSFVAKGMKIWNCLECGHGNVIMTKDTEFSPIGIGLAGYQFFYKQTAHPQSAEPHKLSADFDANAESVKGIGIFQTERGCFACGGGRGKQNLLFGVVIQLRAKPIVPHIVQNIITVCCGNLHSSDAKKLKEMTMRVIFCACREHMQKLRKRYDELLQILNRGGIKNMDKTTFTDLREVKI